MQLSPIAAYFENLRRRFPPEAALPITNAQQSFEQMAWVAEKVPRPARCRSAYVKIGGTNFLVWELDETGDRYQVFSTVYNIPLGILHLSVKPRGMIVVAGFHIDLALLAAAIEDHFKKSPLPADFNPDEPKRKLLLFGFCESFGHHFWNEVGGLVATIDSGLFDGIDGAVVGPYDYFNLGPFLQAKGKSVWKVKSVGSLATPHNLLIYHNNVVTEQARQLVIRHAAKTEASPAEPLPAPAICFQIRRHRRPWVNEEDKIAEIIAACSYEWPNACFIIDGHSTSRGAVFDKQGEIAEETACAKRLADRLPGVDLRCAVGMEMNAKINVLKQVALFVGPIGSGGVLSSWLLRKPTITYGPRSFYSMMRHQEGCVPEGGSNVTAVPEAAIRDVDDENKSFDLDANEILHLIRQEMGRLYPSPAARTA